jgi:hypothetical protein
MRPDDFGKDATPLNPVALAHESPPAGIDAPLPTLRRVDERHDDDTSPVIRANRITLGSPHRGRLRVVYLALGRARRP